MTARYVNNSKVFDGQIYDQSVFENGENVTIAEGSPILTDVAASLDIGQYIQLLSNLEWTYRIIATSPYTIDRNWEGVSPGVAMWWNTHNGESEATAKPNINDVLNDAAAGDIVYVKHTAAGYLLDSRDQIAEIIEPGTGSLLRKPIIIEGYKDNIGDMRYGGAYYQSPLGAYVSGIDTTKKVTISGEDALANLLLLNNSEFVIVRNIHFKDATGEMVCAINGPTNVIFENCIFADSDYITSGSFDNFLFRDCYITGLGYVGSAYAINCHNTGLKCIGCVLDIGNYTKRGFTSGGLGEPYTNGLYFGNLIIGGLYPIYARAGDTVINNTIYDSVNGVRTAFGVNSVGAVTVLNNIFMGKDADSVGILINGGFGAPVINDNNCFWSLAGAMTNPVFNDVPGSGPISLGPNSIEADPLLFSDFKLKENSLCLNSGMGLVDGHSSMGAWQRKSFLGVD